MKSTTHVLLFMSMAWLMASCNSKSADEAVKKTAIKVCQPVLSGNVTKQRFAFIAKPYRSSELSFRVGGLMDQFDAFSGKAYKQGEVIARIDTRDFLIRRDRAEALYNQSKAEFERIETLFHKENLSASSYEKAKADYATARSAFETAVNELSDTRLVAPFNGYVGDVYFERFQEVKSGQRVVSLVDISRLKIEAYVPQMIALRTQKGQTVNLHFDALPGQAFTATVEEISRSTTQNNLSYLLTAVLPNDGGALLSGLSGNIQFDMQEDTAAPVLLIPQQAVCHRPSVGNYVWKVVDGLAKQQPVTLGDLHPEGIAICKGLQTDDVVALSNLRFLSEGTPVSIVKPNTPQR